MSQARVELEAVHGVALLTISRAPANAITPDLLEQLFTVLQGVQSRPEVKAVVLCGAHGRFSTGYDIREFASGAAAFDRDTMAALHCNMCSLLERGAKPTVAALQHMALGGGLEIAMACNARVCTPGTSLGLPELRLAVIPGMGGTQRLPRLVGLQRAVDMMLGSEIIQEKEALRLGLVDLEVSELQLIDAAKQLALEIAEGRRPWRISLEPSERVGSTEEQAAVLAAAEERAASRGRHAQLCVEAVRWGLEKGSNAGLEKEGECLRAAVALDHHRAMVHMYCAYRAAKRLRGAGALLQAVTAVRHLLLYWVYELRGAFLRLIGRV